MTDEEKARLASDIGEVEKFTPREQPFLLDDPNFPALPADPLSGTLPADFTFEFPSSVRLTNIGGGKHTGSTSYPRGEGVMLAHDFRTDLIQGVIRVVDCANIRDTVRIDFGVNANQSIFSAIFSDNRGQHTALFRGRYGGPISSTDLSGHGRWHFI